MTSKRRRSSTVSIEWQLDHSYRVCLYWYDALWLYGWPRLDRQGWTQATIQSHRPRQPTPKYRPRGGRIEIGCFFVWNAVQFAGDVWYFLPGERNLLMACSCMLWLVHWLIDRLLIHSSINWLIDWLIARSIDCLLIHLAIDWLIDWWIVWLTDCVTMRLGFEALLVNIGPVSAGVYLVLFKVHLWVGRRSRVGSFFKILFSHFAWVPLTLFDAFILSLQEPVVDARKNEVFLWFPPPRPKSADRGAISEMDRPTGPGTITIRIAPSLTNYLSRGKRNEYELSTPCCSSWTVHQVDYVFCATPSSLLLAFLLLVCGGPYFLLSAMCLLQ